MPLATQLIHGWVYTLSTCIITSLGYIGSSLCPRICRSFSPPWTLTPFCFCIGIGSRRIALYSKLLLLFWNQPAGPATKTNLNFTHRLNRAWPMQGSPSTGIPSQSTSPHPQQVEALPWVLTCSTTQQSRCFARSRPHVIPLYQEAP